MTSVNELVLIGLSINSEGEVIVEESRKKVLSEDDSFFYIEPESLETVFSRISKNHQFNGQHIDDLPKEELFKRAPSFVTEESHITYFKRFLFDLAVQRLKSQLENFKSALQEDKESYYNDVSDLIEDKIVEISRDNEVIYLSFFYNRVSESFGFVTNLVTYVTDLSGKNLQLFENHQPFKKSINSFNEVIEDEDSISCFILINDFDSVKESCLKLFGHMDILLMEKVNTLENYIEKIYFKQVL